jgi:glycosyltransferase involved in cell wall biosynthesis
VSRGPRRAPGGGRGARIVVDARLLHYNRAGIGRYLRHLYRAIGDLQGRDGVPPAVSRPREQITVLYSRRDTLRPLQECLPRGAVAWTPGHHPQERWALALEGARLRPDLWHAPDHVCPQPLGWRTVLTVHDLAFWRLPESHSAPSRAYYAGLRRSARQATRIICVSQATRRDLLEATGVTEDKVRVVPEAPDPRYLLPPPPAEPGQSGRPYLLCVGTIEPRKNLPAVFRALARLPRPERPELRVVGAPGLDAGAIQALPARLGLNGDVRFLGRRPTEELVSLYAGALALVYPSLLEGFGLPVLEAMGAGAPVIASNRSSVPEVAGDAAILVDPEDESSIASALQRVATSPALREDLRARGRARVARFSWEQTARQTLDVFAEALQS